MTARSPNTFVVGAGPVATAIAGSLRISGMPVLGLWARKAPAARAAAAASGVAAFSSAPPDILLESDAIVLAVRDDAVPSVAAMLIGTGMINQRHVLLHCSGAMPASVALAPAHGVAGGVGTMHPLRAIADAKDVIRTMAGTSFGIEGDERGLGMARRLVAAIGGRPLAVEGADMARYHAAAVMASNYAVALLDAASQMFAELGLGRDAAVAALAPLMEGAVANVLAIDDPDATARLLDMFLRGLA